MIVAVDDERFHLELLRDLLEADGHRVETFQSAAEALDALKNLQPEMIISDIEMPVINGFDFFRTYRTHFAHRHTPFVFLSADTSAETIVKGLDYGADDYLQKPLHAQIVKARVRSILQRKHQYISQPFSGTLARMPFDRILHFCEVQKLTGHVEIKAEELFLSLKFRGGELQLGDNEQLVDRLFDLSDGIFTINLDPINYAGLHPPADDAVIDAAAPPGARDKPMGRLSGITVGQRTFQIQTEFNEAPQSQVVTIVVLNGRVVYKKKSIIADNNSQVDRTRLIDEQHLQVETDIKQRIDDLIETSQARQTQTEREFNSFYDAGFDSYRRNDFVTALSFWEQAEQINPDDKNLKINLAIIRKKLNRDH